MGDFKKLVVWQCARRLTRDIYRATARFPAAERFGLTSQLRRAAISIAANIAEGPGKKNDREMTRFLRIARGSAHEVECQVILAVDLGFLSPPAGVALCVRCREVSRMLNRMIEGPLDLRLSTCDFRPTRPSSD